MSQSGAVLMWLAETTGKFAVDEDDRFEAARWLFFDNHKFTNNYAMHRFQRCFTPQPVHESVLAFLKARTEAVLQSSRSTLPIAVSCLEIS